MSPADTLALSADRLSAPLRDTIRERVQAAQNGEQMRADVLPPRHLLVADLFDQRTDMNDYTPSDAANDYATSYAPAGGYRPWSPRHSEFAAAFDAGIAHERESRKPRTITTAADIAAIPPDEVLRGVHGGLYVSLGDGRYVGGSSGLHYDANSMAQTGPFTLLVPASESASEPERLTDADDERIQPGARVRMVVEYVVDEERSGAYRYPVQLLRKAVATPSDHETFYLLAEAPDPDAEIVAVLPDLLENDDGEDWTESRVRYLLGEIRTAGYDVVKRVDQ